MKKNCYTKNNVKEWFPMTVYFAQNLELKILYNNWYQQMSTIITKTYIHKDNEKQYYKRIVMF